MYKNNLFLQWFVRNVYAESKHYAQKFVAVDAFFRPNARRLRKKC